MRTLQGSGLPCLNVSSEQSTNPNDDHNPDAPQAAPQAAPAAPEVAGQEATGAAAKSPAAQAPGTQAREAENHALRKRANLALLKYGLARLALFVVLTAVIQTAAYLIDSPVPLMISALLALLVAFPLSMLIFPGLRVNANASVAAWQQRRREEKEWVREELAKR